MTGRSSLLLPLPVCLAPLSALLDRISKIAGLTAQHAPVFIPDSPPVLLLLSMQTLISLWVFSLGACFGSFLNVVIYRLPAGMSLGRPKSRCPRCETPLAARDNIPVLGWLLLKGKCRYCQLPIAVRYPVIETVCGGIFLALMFGELLTGAANLPMRHPDHFHIHPGFWLVWFAKYDLSGIYLYHCCLLVLVLATCMIGYDGHRPQQRLTLFAVAVGFIAAAAWPDLRPVPAMPWPESVRQMFLGFVVRDMWIQPETDYHVGVSLRGLLDGLCGTVGGAVSGRMLVSAVGNGRHGVPNTQIRAVRHALLIAGVFLGWQAVLQFTILLPTAFLTHVVLRKTMAQRFPVSVFAPSCFALLFCFLLTWELLDSAVWMIGYEGWKSTAWPWWQDWLVTIIGMSIIALLLSRSAGPAENTDTIS
ncbi:MAG: prepilin peptidase [Planctomycetaceae bacterium]|nr:prepilin peptidase [Planctomycetaceae bacterium]